MLNDFTPQIIGFLCHWCSYEGADAAGRARLIYPTAFKAVHVMCSGRVDPQFVLEAFKWGADGVIILGCPLGGCHYKRGNVQAINRVILLKQMLGQFGISPDRVAFESIGTTESDKFVQVVTQFVSTIQCMGKLAIGGIEK